MPTKRELREEIAQLGRVVNELEKVTKEACERSERDRKARHEILEMLEAEQEKVKFLQEVLDHIGVVAFGAVQDKFKHVVRDGVNLFEPKDNDEVFEYRWVSKELMNRIDKFKSEIEADHAMVEFK